MRFRGSSRVSAGSKRFQRYFKDIVEGVEEFPGFQNVMKRPKTSKKSLLFNVDENKQDEW